MHFNFVLVEALGMSSSMKPRNLATPRQILLLNTVAVHVAAKKCEVLSKQKSCRPLKMHKNQINVNTESDHRYYFVDEGD